MMFEGGIERRVEQCCGTVISQVKQDADGFVGGYC
jgi:hypothetical protein